MDSPPCKTCTVCLILKPLEAYLWRSAAHKKRVSKCRPCMNVYRRTKGKEQRDRRGKVCGFPDLSAEIQSKITAMRSDPRNTLAHISRTTGVPYHKIHNYHRKHQI